MRKSHSVVVMGVETEAAWMAIEPEDHLAMAALSVLKASELSLLGARLQVIANDSPPSIHLPAPHYQRKT